MMHNTWLHKKILNIAFNHQSPINLYIFNNNQTVNKNAPMSTYYTCERHLRSLSVSSVSIIRFSIGREVLVIPQTNVTNFINMTRSTGVALRVGQVRGSRLLK